METFDTPAVIVRAVDYGEADRVVTLLTRARGKVSAIARGARKSRRRFAGGAGADAGRQLAGAEVQRWRDRETR